MKAAHYWTCGYCHAETVPGDDIYPTIGGAHCSDRRCAQS